MEWREAIVLYNVMEVSRRLRMLRELTVIDGDGFPQALAACVFWVIRVEWQGSWICQGPGWRVESGYQEAGVPHEPF